MTWLLSFVASYVLRFLGLSVEPDYQFSIEFTSGSFTNVTSKVERGNWESSVTDLLHSVTVGRGLFELNNDNGLLTPRNNTNLKPGKAIKLTATHRELNILDFDFTRATLTAQTGSTVASITFTRSGATATRVNSSGLIETVPADTPRFDYDPATLQCKGFLIEETRTNLCLRSQELDNAGVWSAFQSTITANTITSPDGSVNAEKVAENTANDAHGVRQQITVAANALYRFSFYAKAAERTKCAAWAFTLSTVTDTGSANFDLSAVTASGSGLPTIQDAGGGWYRCSFNVTGSSAGGLANIHVGPQPASFTQSYVGVSGNGVYIWGTQFELGVSATSYIPTTSVSVTRSDDLAAITTLGTWFSSSEGTLFAEATPILFTGWSSIAIFNDGTSNNRIDLGFEWSANKASAYVLAGGIQQVGGLGSATLTILSGQPNRAVFAYKANDFAESNQGLAAAISLSGSIPTVTRMQLGDDAFNRKLNGHLRRIIYYPKRLSNAALQNLSNLSVNPNTVLSQSELDSISTRSLTTYPLFFGRITEVSVSPTLGARTTLITAVDDWDRVKRLTYTTSLFAGTKVQSLFCALMSLSSVQSFSADASISDSVDFIWYRDRDATNVLEELVQSGNYSLVVDGNGTYYLRDRYWSLFATSINTYNFGDDARIALSDDSVINRTKVTAIPRQLSTNITTLSVIPQAISVPASSAIGFWLSFQDPNEPSADIPVHSLVTPVASTDYYASVGSDGSGTNLTSGFNLNFTAFAASAVVSFYNANGVDAYLTRFQIRGFPVARLSPLSTRFDVVSSQTLFGIRELNIPNQLIQTYSFMDNLSKLITTERKDGRDMMDFTLSNEFPDIFQNTPGGLIAFVDTFGGYTALWRIRGAAHEISMVNGLKHSVKYDTEAFDTIPFLVLDHPTMGQLDAGRMLAI